MCALIAYVQPTPKMVELILMTVLPLQRLYVLKYPLNSRANVSKRRKLGIWLSSGLWIVTTTASIVSGIRNGKDGAEFVAQRMTCMQGWFRSSTSHSGDILRPISSLMFQVGPLFVISAANIWVLLFCSRRHNPTGRRSNLKTKTVVTILIVTSLFVLSVLPGTVVMIFVLFGRRSFAENQYIGPISQHLSFINFVSNYYIYKFSRRRVIQNRPPCLVLDLRGNIPMQSERLRSKEDCIEQPEQQEG